MQSQNEPLENQVNQELIKSEDLSTTPIDVTADRGNVALPGTVQAFRRKLRAQEIAAACPESIW